MSSFRTSILAKIPFRLEERLEGDAAGWPLLRDPLGMAAKIVRYVVSHVVVA